MHGVLLLVCRDLGEPRRPEARRVVGLAQTPQKLLDIADTLKRRELSSKETDPAPATTVIDHFWSHLHEEVAAADMRRMEQFDIFELGPLGGWRVLHGQARMVRGRHGMASDKFATNYVSLRFSSRPCLPRLLNRFNACC